VTKAVRCKNDITILTIQKQITVLRYCYFGSFGVRFTFDIVSLSCTELLRITIGQFDPLHRKGVV